MVVDYARNAKPEMVTLMLMVNQVIAQHMCLPRLTGYNKDDAKVLKMIYS